MKRTFAILAALVAALALPAVAGAADTDNQSTGSQTATVTEAIEVEASSSSLTTDTVNPEGVVTVAYSSDTSLRSNDGFQVSIGSIILENAGVGAGFADIVLSGDSETGISNGDAGEGDDYQDVPALTGSEDISWANNAGEYSGSATVAVSTGY